jgi:hypothetical protein
MSTTNWTSAIYTKDFWTDYIYLTDYYYEVNYFFQFHLPVTERYSLMVDIQSEEITLLLFDQENKRELGYIDTDDQYFCVFRREELEAVSQAIGKNFFENTNIPFLLLDLFTPTTSENDFNITRTKLVSAWRSLHIFTDKELEELFDRYYRKRWVIEKDYSWEHNLNLGWVLSDQYNDCSLRVSQNQPYSKQFPFREFKNMIKDLF